ncbi:MAG: helix-turn-helix domain-containing protein, partial [Corynebacterium sp.]
IFGAVPWEHRTNLSQVRKKLTEQQAATARSLYEAKAMTVAEIGRVLGVSRSTVYRSLDAEDK